MEENRRDDNIKNSERTDYEPNFIIPEYSGIYKDQDGGRNGRETASTADRTGGETSSPSSSATWTNGEARPHKGFSENSTWVYSQAQQDGTSQGNGSAGGQGFSVGSKKKKERKPSPPVTLTRKSLALLIAGCLVISCLFGLGGVCLGSSIIGDQTAGNSEDGSGQYATTGYDLQNATGSNMTVKEITDAVENSVVEITTESVSSDSWMQNYVTEGAGSGVIISKDGYIMTNNHVIEGASKITVTTANEKSYEAELIGTDSTNDVAVVKIKAKNLTPAKFGNSSQLEVGDLAVAIGNPLGELGGTVTAGIISATDRELNIDGKTMKLLQTDSSINPGNSGGGLFNGDGQLIGLVVAKSSGSDVEGLGFAIPINTAASVAEQLMDKGYVSNQPWTGMTYTEGSSGFDSVFGSSTGTVYIYSVDTAKSKLEGFKAGDVVFAVDGTQITSIDDLSGIITSHKVGDKLTFTIVRDGQTKDIDLKLQEKTKAQQEQQTTEEQSQDQSALDMFENEQ